MGVFLGSLLFFKPNRGPIETIAALYFFYQPFSRIFMGVHSWTAVALGSLIGYVGYLLIASASVSVSASVFSSKKLERKYKLL
jgi:hypothetical protein